MIYMCVMKTALVGSKLMRTCQNECQRQCYRRSPGEQKASGQAQGEGETCQEFGFELVDERLVGWY